MGVQSMEMLKVRALLEEKLKQKDFTLIEPNQNGAMKHLQPINRYCFGYPFFLTRKLLFIDVMKRDLLKKYGVSLIIRLYSDK